MRTKICQYCMSEIPLKAKKCKYCHEWQDEDHEVPEIASEENALSLELLNKSRLKKPFQEHLISKITFHYVISVFIFCVFIFFSIQITWYLLNEETVYLYSFLIFSIQIFISWTGLIWISKLIKSNYSSFIRLSTLNPDEAAKDFINSYSEVFNTKYSIIAGILIGMSASLGDYYVGTPFKSLEAKYIFAGFEFINMFFSGAAVYSMLRVAFYIHKMGYKKKFKPFDLNYNESISDIGSLHLTISCLAIVPLFLGVLAKLFGKWEWDILVIIWYVSFAVAIIVYIYLPMQNIHKLMKEDINNQISIIQNKIHKLLKGISSNPSSRNFTKLNELRQLEKSITSQNTWPFDTKGLSAAFFAVILPIILLVVDKYWNI